MSTNDEELFKHHFEVFRKEVTTGIMFLYQYLTIHVLLSTNKQLYVAINQQPFFWNTSLGSLQQAMFITLRRIFDQESKHNLDQLIRVAQANSSIFSIDSLRVRKSKLWKTTPEELEKYLTKAYVPTSSYFREIRKEIKQYRRMFESNYRNLINNLYAHTRASKPEEIKALLSKANIKELKIIFGFLESVYLSFQDLFFNGKKPVIKVKRINIRKALETDRGLFGDSPAEITILDTRDFFNSLINDK